MAISMAPLTRILDAVAGRSNASCPHVINLTRHHVGALSSLQSVPATRLRPLKRRKLAAVQASAEQEAPSVQNDENPVGSFKIEQETADGKLVIAPLESLEVGAASVVLTRAFATSPQGIPIEDGRKYCQNMLNMPPKGVFLVGRLYPKDPNNADWLPPNQTSRLICTASISFDPVSRETFQTLQPPDAEAYLCNIAVDPKFRRKGIARVMLAACETLAVSQGFERFYLHVRLGDDAARALYETSGYTEVDSDSWLVKLRGMTPAALLVKEFGKF